MTASANSFQAPNRLARDIIYAIERGDGRLLQSALMRLNLGCNANIHATCIASIEKTLTRAHAAGNANTPIGILAALCVTPNAPFTKLSPTLIEKTVAALKPDAAAMGNATILDKVVVITNALQQADINEQTRQSFSQGYNKLDENARQTVEQFFKNPNTPLFPTLPALRAFFTHNKNIMILQ